MTQDNKEILLKVLSEQLSYGVLILDTAAEKYGKLYQINPDSVWYDCQETGDVECQSIFNVKPYLFPLSSMTEEQKKEYNFWKHEVPVCHYMYGDVIEAVELLDSPESFEYLIENHFDYRGLIPMGLANDATGLNVY